MVAAIDWRVAPPTLPARALAPTTSAAAGWQASFVSHLGAAPDRLNPNAALKLHLDVTPKTRSDVGLL